MPAPQFRCADAMQVLVASALLLVGFSDGGTASNRLLAQNDRFRFAVFSSVAMWSIATMCGFVMNRYNDNEAVTVTEAVTAHPSEPGTAPGVPTPTMAAPEMAGNF
jgi:dipeptidyl aminopeptidase/acylaminoacyl peptidase